MNLEYIIINTNGAFECSGNLENIRIFFPGIKLVPYPEYNH